jgi:hypothetical protein
LFEFLKEVQGKMEDFLVPSTVYEYTEIGEGNGHKMGGAGLHLQNPPCIRPWLFIISLGICLNSLSPAPLALIMKTPKKLSVKTVCYDDTVVTTEI